MTVHLRGVYIGVLRFVLFFATAGRAAGVLNELCVHLPAIRCEKEPYVVVAVCDLRQVGPQEGPSVFEK